MKRLFLIIILAFFASCAKTVSNPETSDEIYRDLQQEFSIAAKSLEEEEKNLISLKKERGIAIPQTGQIKFSNKKVSDSEERLNQLKQQKLYFEIKLETRKEYVRDRYAESLRSGGRPWPDKNETDLYRAVMKFNKDKIAWEKEKGSKKPVPHGTQKPKADAEAKKH